MKKIYLFLSLIIFIVVEVNGQSFSFTTNKTPGSTISININAVTEDRDGIWLDLNNNGEKDVNEEVTTFGTTTNPVTVTIQSPSITVHGRINYFRAQTQGITSMTISEHPTLINLQVAFNELKTIDLSQLNVLQILQVGGNSLSELDLRNNTNITQLYANTNGLSKVLLPKDAPLTLLNLQRNSLPKDILTDIISNLPDRKGDTAVGRILLTDTRYDEGNDVKAYHIAEAGLKNWEVRDASTNTKYEINNSISFTTSKSVGSSISLNLSYFPGYLSTAWIDLNNSRSQDIGEEITNFGTLQTFTIGAQQITVNGLAEKIIASSNNLTSVDASKNDLLTHINLDNNRLEKLDLSIHKSLIEISSYSNLLIELLIPHNSKDLNKLNIAGNKLSTNAVDLIINSLYFRNGMEPGVVTLIESGESDNNEVTRKHISNANNKNWIIMDTNGKILSISDFPGTPQLITNFSDKDAYVGTKVTFPEETDQGLQIIYTMEENKEDIAVLENNTLIIKGEGEVKITAKQEGDVTYSACTETVTITTSHLYSWLLVPAINIQENWAHIAGPENLVKEFTKFYINEDPVELIHGIVELTGLTGDLELMATDENATQIIKLKIRK